MRVVKEDGPARLITRNGNDYSAAFPELIRPIAALPYSSLLMDGELVILDEQGRPSFQRLQNRARFDRRMPDLRRASDARADLQAHKAGPPLLVQGHQLPVHAQARVWHAGDGTDSAREARGR